MRNAFALPTAMVCGTGFCSTLTPANVGHSDPLSNDHIASLDPVQGKTSKGSARIAILPTVRVEGP